MTYRKSLFISIILHCLPFILFLFVSSNNNNQNNKPNKSINSAKLAPPPGQTTTIDVVEYKHVNKQPRKPKVEHKCKEWYGGVGVVHRLGIVQEAPSGYPAAEAGVLPGDLLLNDNLKGEVGTEVTIKVLRGENFLNFVVTRAKICYNIGNE